MPEELDQVVGDGVGRRIGRREWQVAVGCVRFDDRDDLVRVAAKMGIADAVVGAHERDRNAVRR